MLKKGAKFNLEKTVKFTDLMAAAANGHTEVVKLLLEKGANPDLQDNESRTALDYAGNPDIRLLLSK
jgi:ankyrin repeat protein